MAKFFAGGLKGIFGWFYSYLTPFFVGNIIINAQFLAFWHGYYVAFPPFSGGGWLGFIAVSVEFYHKACAG